MFYIINGSPRTNGNTVQMLNALKTGIEKAGKEATIIHLYNLNFKGCISCFSCKRRGGKLGQCAMRDDLSPILEEMDEAEGIVLGSPFYYADVTGELRSFIERFFFSYMLYNKPDDWHYPASIPSAMIATCGVPDSMLDEVRYICDKIAGTMTTMFGQKCEQLISNDAYQFKNPDQYEARVFDHEKKLEHYTVQFPKDCELAEQLGFRMASQG